MVLTKTNIDAIRVYRSTWSQQIKDALTVNGGDVENATNADYLLHFLSFGWKVNKIVVILFKWYLVLILHTLVGSLDH